MEGGVEQKDFDLDFDLKAQALLSLQAMLIDYSGSYHSHEYLHYVLSQLEKVKKAPRPWRLMDTRQYRTFQALAAEHFGRDRRSGANRRQGGGPVQVDHRREDRRWEPVRDLP